ncbi:MAG: UDP-N-acetylmuramoyl-L-alanyl-D-glutamate--2,6-diaminopimelate ligase [Candidatus Wildermuthbacteria bacterium]|nr:UDP-N-acetylmuramoyl-L-alanyl-D-glutamate--2,6-diaminopimelate ligase [Candidatus Wildermuthbacteria bacterium]
MKELKEFLRSIIPPFALSWYHFLWALLGAILYGFPARRLTVIGVTGTDGKSTTVEMIRRILQEAGYKTAATSSVWVAIGEEKQKNHRKMSMPGRMFLQKFLARAVAEGCTHAVIEVSSEGILQHRHRFLNMHTAVITNLSPEHIERHGSFENYRAEKQKLFFTAKRVHVINGDDENAIYFLQIPSKAIYVYGVSSKPQESSLKQTSSSKPQTILANDVQETKEGTDFSIGDTLIHLNLIGQFNAYNALAAICVGLAHGVSTETCRDALAKMPRMPGRTDPVFTKPFCVLIDYAVTPKALENLYSGVRSLFHPRRMICVFGACGGGRDKWKRPVLGKIAGAYCDEIILTNEDPYDEDPAEILSQIEEGAQKSVQKVMDRREAIRKALTMAQEDDAVVVSGKGSEDVIAVAGGKKIPWDERRVIEEEFAKLDK